MERKINTEQELFLNGVTPEEVALAPFAERPLVPVILLGVSNGEDDPLLERHPKDDLCELGKDRRESLELSARKELIEGLEVDPYEAFEEALTHQDLQN
jgi:hypothetical protein